MFEVAIILAFFIIAVFARYIVSVDMELSSLENMRRRNEHGGYTEEVYSGGQEPTVGMLEEGRKTGQEIERANRYPETEFLDEVNGRFAKPRRKGTFQTRLDTSGSYEVDETLRVAQS